MFLFIPVIAITIAECIKSKHMVDSIFIKMKAIQCLGDNVHAFKLAVLCKFLRPEVSFYWYKIKIYMYELLLVLLLIYDVYVFSICPSSFKTSSQFAC